MCNKWFIKFNIEFYEFITNKMNENHKHSKANSTNQKSKKKKERDGNYMKTKIKQSKCNTTKKRTTTIYD